jgi:predicted extracellular nuclease
MARINDNRRRWFTSGISSLALFSALSLSGNAGAALLNNTLDLPLIAYNNQGTTTYDATSDAFVVDASPLSILVPANPPVTINPDGSGSKIVVINITVDDTGALSGGAPGDDLIVSGEVNVPGLGLVSGVLLTGEVTGFGFQDSGGPTDNFDFAFTLTGGLLAGLYPTGDVGVSLISEGSNFVNDFSVDFGGDATGQIGSVAAALAALGDRVWEDLDADGVQDCADDNGNGILGDVDPVNPSNPAFSDQGSECGDRANGGAGIAGVTVNLLQPDINGDCTIALGVQTVTGQDGFYLFDNLVPGDYCVQFGQLPADFCDTDGFALGAARFTGQNLGADEAIDSDADPVDGTTDPVSLAAAETNRNLDAGYVCPAKIGNFVWEDLDKDGLQGGEPGVGGVVVELFECGLDGVAGSSDDINTGEFRVTEPDGSYMFGAEPGVLDLPPGDYYVKFDPSTFPPGYDCTTPKAGDDAIDRDCLPPNGIAACTTLGSRGINLNQDCGIVPTSPPSGGFCGDPATYIHDIQGSGMASPEAGNAHVIEAVVVGDFQLSTEFNGFFVQEEDTDVDADPTTSNGIFVYAPGAIDVSVGDVVRVQGTVEEFFDLTRMSSVVSVTDCDTTGTATATPVTLPVSSVNDFEAFEGMAVNFPQALYITEFFNFDRFGEIVLATDRQFQPTAVFEPGTIDQANLVLANSLSRITLDDGRTSQNPDPAIHPNGSVFDLTNLFRGGDSVQGVTGVMDYTFGLYRIQPTQGANYTLLNPRPAVPDSVGGSLTVASFNVLNYFTTLDDSGSICGPAADQGCRGADNANEFTRQRDKIINAIVTMNADIVGLMEIENHATDAAVTDLVSGLNAVAGAGTYSAVSTGTIGDDVIKVGLIYQPASVIAVGGYAVLDSSVNPAYNDIKNRPALAQTFEQNGTGSKFTVVVNHLKSKGSSCADIGDPDTGDGQGNCNLTRKGAAVAEAAWLATDPTGSGDNDFLIIGDLNSYDKEDPIGALLADGYTDLLKDHSIDGEFAYTFVFDGQFGYLHHALANADLLDQIAGATVWHINADEPDLIDYDTSFKKPAQDALYVPDAYRSSDHDPVLIGLELNAPPDCSNAVSSIGRLWPPNHRFHSINVLGVTDPDGDAITITIDSIYQDEPVDAPGSGNTSPDGRGVGTSIAEVRAERAGGGNGRVYIIDFTADDQNGGTCTGYIEVGVPKSKGKKGGPIDDGSIHDSSNE